MRRRALLAAAGTGLAAGLTGCLSASAPAVGTAWSRQTADAANTYTTSTEGPTSDLYRFWQRELPGNYGPTCSPVVGDGTVYVASGGSPNDQPSWTWLGAYDATTGEPTWETKLGQTVETASLHSYADSLVLDRERDRVLVQTRAGLQSVGADGSVDWTFENIGPRQMGPTALSPVVAEDTVVTATYATTGDSGLEAVFGLSHDGTERWRVDLPDRTPGQLTAVDGTVYVPSLYGDQKGILALDATTGERLFTWDLPAYGPLSVSNGTAYLPLRDGGVDELVALDAQDGTAIWRQGVGGRWPESGLAVADGLVYAIAESSLVVRRAETGEVVWRFGKQSAVTAELQTSPVVAGGHVYVHGYRNSETDSTVHLFVLDAETGEQRGQVALPQAMSPDSVPAVTDGLVFSAQRPGSLVAIGECDTQLFGDCVSR
ncbi:PQQ-binding-like beta-propeller repeat protein [Haloarchaeobius sp. DFWS5]|uniref:outer membrane protein assembly factor BamB family protein n=1 Tax=Haloarchaeobius sp. DFWS5 TaxID=3446114 RepID=UPI003EBC421F